MKKLLQNKSFKGFTLIELLIVIAVLGVLATVVLVAVDPLQQLARGRDAGRKTTAAQLGNAVAVYFTAQNKYIDQAATAAWVGTLVSAGELKQVPVNPVGSGYTSVCEASADSESGTTGGPWCYKATAADAVVYVLLESKSEDAKCNNVAPTNERPFFVWSSNNGRGGVACYGAAAFPQPGAVTFVD